MQIILDTRGLQISVRNACFMIESVSEARIIHPQRVSSILITSPCRISSPALLLAAENQIPVIICNNFGRAMVRMWSPSFLNIASLRRKQYSFCQSSQSMNWAQEIIEIKIQGQIENLQYLASKKLILKSSVEDAIKRIKCNAKNFSSDPIDSNVTRKKRILYMEAHAAAKYWKLAGTKLPPPFSFTNRVKRNPADGFNASINYLYGMLRHEVETSILSYGLDPALGIIHRDGYRMPSLVFDVMEPFRPIMDRLLTNAIINRELPDNIISLDTIKPCIIKEGRHKLITLFNQKMQSKSTHRNTSTTLKNQILLEVKYLTDQIKNHEESGYL